MTWLRVTNFVNAMFTFESFIVQNMAHRRKRREQLVEIASAIKRLPIKYVYETRLSFSSQSRLQRSPMDIDDLPVTVDSPRLLRSITKKLQQQASGMVLS